MLVSRNYQDSLIWCSNLKYDLALRLSQRTVIRRLDRDICIFVYIIRAKIDLD